MICWGARRCQGFTENLRGGADIICKVVKRRNVEHTVGITSDGHKLGKTVSPTVGNVECNNGDTQGCANLSGHGFGKTASVGLAVRHDEQDTGHPKRCGPHAVGRVKDCVSYTNQARFGVGVSAIERDGIDGRRQKRIVRTSATKCGCREWRDHGR